MDRLRSLNGDEFEITRRASHSGFETPSMYNPDLLRRRQSMPATLVKKDDKARKLHRSSACVNLIEELDAVKIVGKATGKPGSSNSQKVHTLGPELQDAFRSRRSSCINPIFLLDHSEENDEVKKSTSFENMRQRENGETPGLRLSSSENKISGLEVQDPAENIPSDVEDED
ncbi:uncharacterized protein LOC143464772 [Clavelina lepadiformis]|uniref:Uncharacterized protein n=1 Tax=Clavelina lepadiformis TaxID=159417 RepID=A0ABP0EVV3_CLALP